MREKVAGINWIKAFLVYLDSEDVLSSEIAAIVFMLSFPLTMLCVILTMTYCLALGCSHGKNRDQ